jgi:hypothetical protein
VLRRAPQHGQHGLVLQRQRAEAGNVQKDDLVGAVAVVAGRQLHRLAQVAHVAGAGGLAHVILVALGHHQVAGVVGPHVQAGNDLWRERGANER